MKRIKKIVVPDPVRAGTLEPFVKWAGGKRGLVPELLQHVPKKIDCYHEPFAGGAALFFALAAEQPRRYATARLADVNPDLIAAYIAVRDDVEGLIDLLQHHAADHAVSGAQHYYAIRALDPETLSPTARGARMIYLNRTCFNGLWRVNRSGNFNVPIGSYERPRICDAIGLRLASQALQDVTIECASFDQTLAAARHGDFIYLDPPYVAATKSADFTAFSADGFKLEQQELLADAARVCVERGVTVLASNADLPYTNELYTTRGFQIARVTAHRAIAASKASRKNAEEILAISEPAAPIEPAAAPIEPAALIEPAAPIEMTKTSVKAAAPAKARRRQKHDTLTLPFIPKD